MEKITGRNPVTEALRAGRAFDRLLVQKGAGGGGIGRLLDEARRSGVEVRFEEKQVLDRLAGGGGHQGAVAFVSDFRYCDMDDMLEHAASRNEAPLIVVADGVEDPHNLGAIVRTAECAGAHGVVIHKRRSASVTEVVAKASAGATEHMRIARETNISRALEKLKAAGLWAVGLEMGGRALYDVDMAGPLALVVGGEGGGLSRLVAETCDDLAAIPMAGRINSLNASNAAAVALYEAVRRRMGK